MLTPHSLCSIDELYQHPEWRLEDMIWAFCYPSLIKFYFIQFIILIIL